MKETGKCYEMRLRRGDFTKFLCGLGIDIGCGDDPLVSPHGIVDQWDLKQGDAMLMKGVSDNKYDFVYSSHCLEHMRNIPEALKNWTRILKPGGYLYVVVPDYVRYEKMHWPSRFNSDHKHSFSCEISRNQVRRGNHWDEPAIQLVLHNNAVTLLSIVVEDQGFNHNDGLTDQTHTGAMAQICFVGRKRR